MYRSLPADVPAWSGRRPYVTVALLRWRNAYRLHRTRVLPAILLALAAACGLAEIPQTGPILRWLGSNVIVTLLAATCLFGLSAIRRRENAATEAASSWLTALPAKNPVALRVMGGSGARLLLLLCFVALSGLLRRLDGTAAWRLSLALLAAAVLGSLAGLRLRRATGDDAPGFHYAIVRRVRARWATAPSLWPLSYWAAAQGRVFSRPKVLSRVAFLVLITLPLGTPGQVALAIAAAAIAVVSMTSLTLAAIRVAFDAARWLAPTTLPVERFTTALVWRVILIQALSAAVMIFLACAIDLPRALRLGVVLGIAFLVGSLALAAVACRCACRRVGLGATFRGA